MSGVSIENQVLAEAMLVAHADPRWARRPYWWLRRCVVPYVAARQFVLLRRANGIPIAFAGWVCDNPDHPRPWHADGYMPSTLDFPATGSCCITDIISPVVPAMRVRDEVARWLKLAARPPWIERDEGRRIVHVHPGGASVEEG